MADSETVRDSPSDVTHLGARTYYERRTPEEAARNTRLRAMGPTMSFNLGTIDTLADDDDEVVEYEARDDSTDVMPRNATVLQAVPYKGKRIKLGSIVILLGKKGNSLKHMCMYTVPTSMGKAVCDRLEKKNGGKKMKQRLPGIEWVGMGNDVILNDSKYLFKSGWFANTGTCGSPGKLVAMIKKLCS